MRVNYQVLIGVIILFTSCYEPKQKEDDFNQFWEHSLNQLNETPLSYEVIKDSVVGNKKWTLNKIKSFQDVHFYAWVSHPLDSLKHPVRVRFHGFGRGNKNVDEIKDSWFLKQSNYLNVLVDIRGQGLSTDQIKFNGFLTNGLKDKKTYIYRGAFMDAVRAVDFAADHPSASDNISVFGGSQGGALSVVATALNPKVDMTIIGFPFFTDIKNYPKDKWPMKIWIHYANKKGIEYDDFYKTLSYFDMLNFADKIDTPLFLRTQATDTVTPKEGAIKFYNLINSKEKEIHIEDCVGHGCSSKSSKINKLEKAFIEQLAN